MSVSRPRYHLLRVAHLTMCAAVLVSLGACYHAPSSALGTGGVREERRQSIAGDGLRRFPGVDVVPTGHGAFVIQIHSGMVGFGEPLYVIDGAPMMIAPSRGIDWFKPEDIAAIKVLKTPAELAIYGPRGVNGAIVITTMQAAKRRS
jgi:TonB-dependent SusC/RagA subfamily outer membrane receptor